MSCLKEPVPVVIRGVYYPSQAAARRSLGLARNVVYNALERGTIDSVGLGRNYSQKKPVIADDLRYESISDAAKAFDVPKDVLRGHIRRAKTKAKTTCTYNGVTYQW